MPTPSTPPPDPARPTPPPTPVPGGGSAQTSTPLAIHARGLTRSFGATTAVAGIDLDVPTATVFGLLGPNGAGKTTTVRMLATQLLPHTGTAQVLGLDVRTRARQIRERIGVTGQYASLDEELPGRRVLALLARLHGYRRAAARERVDGLLEAFALTGAADRAVRTYSGGMRRRLDIAASILGSPELLFLDEPTTGLDPHSRGQVWELVRAIVDQGTTVLLTTQYLEEADRLASSVAVIDQGRVLTQGSPAQLRARHGGARLNVRVAPPVGVERACAVLAEHGTVRVRGRGIEVVLALGSGGGSAGAVGGAATRALGALDRAQVAVEEFALERPSLDEVFLSLTGRTPVSAPEPEGGGEHTGESQQFDKGESA